MKRVTKLLKSKIELLPKKPGIYLFKDKDDDIIYIGKAHSLKDRVYSYFQLTSDAKVNNILSETADIDFILTDSNKEAAFLENNFVRRYQPKHNIRLKDDKSFPYLKVTVQEEFPGIYFTRKVEPDKSRCFGPFSLAHQARKSISLVNKFFGIRGCEEPIPGKRTRPCLEYDLKLCSAPCVNCISESEYKENVKNALLFLEGKTEELLKILKKRMMEAASQEKFEEAARCRDIIRTIEHIREKPKLISPRMENKDIFGFSRDKERVAIYVFFMRNGRVVESEEISSEEKRNVPDEEVLWSFFTQFYENRSELPDEILLPFPLTPDDKVLEKLFPQAQRKIEVTVPRKGKNRQLIEMAQKNAELLLQKKEGEHIPLAEIKNVLNLKSFPRRIEGFDISNIGGKETVGSLVVFEDGLPKKEEYRKYKIKTVRGPNDVASLQEVIGRRYIKVLEEKGNPPDLILVDGGKGQLSAARKSLQELGLGTIPVISLAKKQEIIFTPWEKEGLSLERTSPALKLFQNIRNEAHRFALSFHRTRRTKKNFESLLDNIPGLGNKRKMLLRAKYKGMEEIKMASHEELASVIGKKAAYTLKQSLEKF